MKTLCDFISTVPWRKERTRADLLSVTVPEIHAHYATKRQGEGPGMKQLKSRGGVCVLTFQIRAAKKKEAGALRKWGSETLRNADFTYRMICLTSLCDWSRKLAPHSQPIRYKNKTNHHFDWQNRKIVLTLKWRKMILMTLSMLFLTRWRTTVWEDIMNHITISCRLVVKVAWLINKFICLPRKLVRVYQFKLL